MKHHSLALAILGCIVALPACGPGLGGSTASDSDSATDSDPTEADGSSTDPMPSSCQFGGSTYEDGEEFEGANGCVQFRCDNGSLVTLEDNRTVVAGDLELSTQEAVDQQICLGTVEGSLSISGGAADLTPLVSLTRVGGALTIAASEATTLAGLQTLAEVGGDIVIADNANLTSMSFQAYMSAFGDVTIQNNDALTSLAGAEFIGQCGACSTGSVDAPGDIQGQAPSAEPQGDGGADGGLDEPQGGSFYGAILIADNDVLTDISALGNLFFAWSDFRLRNNASLSDLLGLSLTEVQGDLEITDHATLPAEAVDQFVGQVYVAGATTVCGNLDGLACPK